MAAAQVLDMTMEDLQVLVIGHVDRDGVDAVLWDPMPGGSGLLEQICQRFSEVVAAATEIVSGCPSDCESSCIDCLQTFRNSFYHRHLYRKIASDRLLAWGRQLKYQHDIPPMQPSQPQSAGNHPVNEAERRLQHMLLAAGFENGVRGEQIRLDRAIGTTTPDVIYRARITRLTRVFVCTLTASVSTCTGIPQRPSRTVGFATGCEIMATT